jgi:hypothetical protein
LAATVLFVALAAATLATSGCSLLESEPEYDTVTDYGGRYHMLVPSGWQSVADSSILAVYASEELPEDAEALDVLSIVVLSGEAVEDVATSQMLTDFVESRSAERSWQEVDMTQAASATVGSREASFIEVSALDSTGAPFQARFYQVRTAGVDYIVVAVMPGEDAEEAWADLDGIVERWYWHVPDDSAAGETATPTGEESSE